MILTQSQSLTATMHLVNNNKVIKVNIFLFLLRIFTSKISILCLKQIIELHRFLNLIYIYSKWLKFRTDVGINSKILTLSEQSYTENIVCRLNAVTNKKLKNLLQPLKSCHSKNLCGNVSKQLIPTKIT
jgi:hypothetical protein